MAKKGKPTAVMTRPETAEATELERAARLEHAWQAIEQIGELNRDHDPDEVMRIVTEVVEEVRQEHYEREQREASRRR